MKPNQTALFSFLCLWVFMLWHYIYTDVIVDLLCQRMTLKLFINSYCFGQYECSKRASKYEAQIFDFFSNGHELFSALRIVCLCLLMALQIQHLCFQIQEGHKSLYHVIICKWSNIHIIGLLRIAWDKEVHSTNANFLADEELCLSPSTHISCSGNWELLGISQKSHDSSF